MIRVYINYPVPHLTIHGDLTCGTIMQGRKKGQRHIRVNTEKESSVLRRFRDNEFRFSATKELNDMWLEIDLSNKEDEIEFVSAVKKELSKHYKPFGLAPINEHC